MESQQPLDIPVDATTAMLATPTAAGPPVVTPEIRRAIARFIRIDDDLKTCTREARGRRGELRELHNAIVGYMVTNSVERLSVRRGECRLELKRRERHLRPTRETMLVCLRAVLADKSRTPADAEGIVDRLRGSGGTSTEWRLARRNANAAVPRPRKAEGGVSTPAVVSQPTRPPQSPSRSST